VDHPDGHKNVQVCLQDTAANILARSQDRIGRTALATDTNVLYIFNGTSWSPFLGSVTGLSSSLNGTHKLQSSVNITEITSTNTTSMSSSIWVKFNQISTTPVFVWAAYSTPSLDPSWSLPNSNGWYVMCTSSGLLYESGPNQITRAQAFTTGQWYNIITVHSGTNASLYVDGNLIGTGSNNPGNGYDSVGPTQTGWGTLLTIGGGSSHNTNYANALFDEAALFDKALTTSEVASVYNGGVPPNLTALAPVSWWRMGNGIGDTSSGGGTAVNGQIIGTIADQEGGYDLAPIGSPTFSTDTP
jgi:hypothetical protein